MGWRLVWDQDSSEFDSHHSGQGQDGSLCVIRNTRKNKKSRSQVRVCLHLNSLYCPLAQLAEHTAVNRGVLSSNLRGAAKAYGFWKTVIGFWIVLKAPDEENNRNSISGDLASSIRNLMLGHSNSLGQEYKMPDPTVCSAAGERTILIRLGSVVRIHPDRPGQMC